MAVDFGNLEWFVLVATAETPDPMKQYHGRPVGVPPGKVLPTSPDTLIINGVAVYGYARTNGSTGWLEWVMTPVPDPNVQALEAIPGPAGWASPDAKTVYAGIGLALLRLGVPGTDVRSGLHQLYHAALQNVAAQQQAATTPDGQEPEPGGLPAVAARGLPPSLPPLKSGGRGDAAHR
jgi:hypothetical protein